VAELARWARDARGSMETRRYITPVGSRDHMDAAAEFLGLTRLHLKAG